MALRPSLPATSSDFALHSSSTSSSTSNADEFNPLLMRFRRPSLLAPPRASFYSESRIHSPLVDSSFTIPMSRRYTTSSTASGEESESDKEKMWTDSPSSGSSGANTPSLAAPIAFTDKDKSNSSLDSDTSMKSIQSDPISSPGTVGSVKTARPRSPSPPSRVPIADRDAAVPETPPPKARRRMSHPIRNPRILNLLADSHPEDSEVKSEAQFQRFVASFSESPPQHKIPRAPSDRGRYPEEAGLEEPTREDTSSDDEDEFGFSQPFSYTGTSEPINISKTITPAHSVYGDDTGMSESPGYTAMDIDMQPASVCGSPKLNTSSWRYTPPPTSSSAVRSAKRKLEDRYDPYPSAKRRAVSPSVSYLRETLNHTPRTPGNGGRITIPLPHPIAIPVGPSSSTSSPVVTPSAVNGPRSMSWTAQSVLSSPTLRAQMGLASPVLRPMMRRREEGREVEGAGDGVNGLSLE
ncbi:hypothetical protein BDY19DRAFT_988170 [Irpex rosettiformis]|uniref:Uncharacterized protein n=1 Tax=Irpex rosettiformis TaxID=378272 RepID=A0ACB8UJ67_9APHY|nr:hypothetical protein BDY19DRAFT_988170 [Irpex rosettiformis]